MKKTVLLIALAIAFSSAWAAKPSKKQLLRTERDSVSYAIGLMTGYMFMQESTPDYIRSVNPDMYMEGFKHGLSGAGALMEEIYADQYIREAGQRALEKVMRKNREAAEAFLADNARRDGVKVTDSGLQYMIVRQGEGEKPGIYDRVTVNYEGRLIDGTVFDSSYERGEPSSFLLTQVINGWAEGLQLMSPGSEFTLYIPSDLAYGESTRFGAIEPNSLLIFDVELISVEYRDDEEDEYYYYYDDEDDDDEYEYYYEEYDEEYEYYE